MLAATVRRRALLRAVALGAAATVPVVLLALAVRGGSDAVVQLDEAAVRAATEVTRSSGALHTTLVVWQEVLAARYVNPVLVPLLCLWAWRRHGLRDRALWAASTVAVGWALQLAAKGLVQRARPVLDETLAHSPGSSFPSGHAANTTVLAVTMTALAWPVLGRTARVLVPAGAALVVVLTAADRVLLGVHYPTDVVGGVLLGVAVSGASLLGWTRSKPLDDTAGDAPARASTPR